MKRNIVYILLLLLAGTSISWAQSVSVKGRVIENVDELVSGLEAATISLLTTDSLFIQGCTSDENGNFRLQGVEKGNYMLAVSYIGYQPSYLVLQNLVSSIDIGEIELGSQAIGLKEVEVTASQVIQRIDRQIILPSQLQVKTSYNAYDLLNNMMINRLLVNPLSRTLEVSGGGAVQTRINGIQVSDREVAAIRAKDVLRVEYIEDPGKRYGDSSLGAVINIITRRQESGGVVNFQSHNSPHVLWGENFLSAKFNHRRSEWGVDVVNLNRGYSGRKRDVTEAYYLDDQTIERVQEGINDKSKRFENYINLTYNLSEPDKYTFQAVWRNNIENSPYSNLSNKLYEKGSTSYIWSHTNNKTSSYSPSLDLYYQRTLPHKQSIELNVVGTLINSTNDRFYREYTTAETDLASIITNVDGKKRSVIGEAIYDKEFEKIKLNAGIRHSRMRTENEYRGTTPVNSNMDQSTSSFFAEVQGKLNKVSYSVGAGATRSWFREGAEEHSYYIFNPTLRLSYAPHPNSFIRYRFNIEPAIPSLGSLTDVEQALDTIQIVRGNPRLSSYKMINNNLNYSYNYKVFRTGIDMRYQYYSDPIMESVFVENGKLIIMDENQRSFQRFNVEGNIGLRGITVAGLKNFLSLQLSAGTTHYRSEGNTYLHTYNNFYYNLMAMLSYKSVMFMGQFRKNQNSLYGETIDKGENMTAFMLVWSHKNLQLGVGALFPFTNNYRRGSERMSEVAPVTTWEYIKEAGQLFTLRVAYNFEFGRKYKAGNKNLSNEDRDKGLINTNR